MPTPQSLASPKPTISSSEDLLNGLSQDGPNGDASNSIPNGIQRSVDEDRIPTPESLQAQKLRAKAQVAAQNPKAPSEDVHGGELQQAHGESQNSHMSPNGFVQTRKRSRSGNLISRPVDTEGLERRRGANDPDGTALNSFVVAEYTARDLLHWSTILEDTKNDDQLQNHKRQERDYYSRMRSQRLPPPQGARGPLAANRRLNDPFATMPQTAQAFPQASAVQDPRAPYGRSYPQGATPQVRDPRQLQLPLRPTKRVTLLRKELLKHADQLDDLVPIRLDIEWEHADLGKIRLRDSFTWNLHERLVKPHSFAEILVEDFGLSLEKCKALVDMITASIEEQIQDYYPHVFIDDGPVDPQQPYDAYKDDEVRITVKLNITIGQHTLVDQFEWDINNSSEAAEVFAKQMSQELSLSGEFTTAIAHSIREQAQLFTRYLYVLGHQFDGRPITDEDLKSSLGSSPMLSSFRPYQAAKEFTPYFYELNDTELEKTELSLSREERRQKRSVSRRGGPALPDIKDRQRTIRTLTLSSVIPGAAESLEDSKIFKRAPAAKSKKSYNRDGEEDSDDLESEVSSEEAIPSHLLSGTARTRGMRGAATAAQAAMRGTLGRSATPEISAHHHETRTSGRKGGARDYREESADDAQTSLIVKLKFPRDRFRRFLQDLAKNKNKTLAADTPTHATRRSKSATPGQGTPGPNTMGPPSTPAQQPQAPAAAASTHHGSPAPVRDNHPNPIHPHAAQLGRVDAAGPPTAENPAPPPPPWLTQSLARLQNSYPNDKFEGLMRYTPVSLETDLPVSREAPPDTIKYMFYPRIKCLDCPTKNYTPGPETGVSNFEVHLRNRAHRDKVEARVAREKKSQGKD